jgi:hypothetical protein
VIQWANWDGSLASGASDPELEERLAALEPLYKSRGETQIGRLLDRYDIPFFYEMPLVVLDRGQYRLWHPDFTLPEYGGLIVEYDDMPNLPEYAAGTRYKQQVYADNGVNALFLCPDDLQGADWLAEIMERIGSQTARYGYGSGLFPGLYRSGQA